MDDSVPSEPLDRAWRRQSVWSQAASNLKRGVRRARLTVLVLSTCGAALAALAVVADVGSRAGKLLAFAGALSLGLAGVVRSRADRQTVSDWTRARSVAEAIKSEVYVCLAAAGDYGHDNRDATLACRTSMIEQQADDLLPRTLGVTPASRRPPAVNDVKTYIEERVTRQITEYYRPQAAQQQRLLRRVRRAELALAFLGAALAAGAATLGVKSLEVWVPVVTTVSAALTAHAAAERYEFLLVEYLRTATELERLRDRHGRADGLEDEEFIRACEHVISVQNEGWMAKLTTTSEDSAAAT